jgi:hypothetical protein
LKDEEAIDWCKRISKLSFDKGNKLKEGHGGLPKRGLLGGCGKEKKEGRRRGVRKMVFFLFLCVERCSWEVCV